MIWPWLTVYALIGLALFFIFIAAGSVSFAPFVVACTLLVTAFFFSILAMEVSIGRHYHRANCHHFGEQTGRTVRFVIYSTFSTGCLTPTSNGKWIDISNLREFGDSR